MNRYPFADFGPRPWDVVVEVPDAHGPVWLAATLSPQEIDADEFAREREELVLRSAWLRVGRGERRSSADAFSRECTRLNALRGIHRGASRPAPF